MILQIDGTVVPDSFHVLYILGGLLFVVSVITQGVMYSDQCIAIERIEENEEKEKIYEEKATALIDECKVYLKEVYPDLEKGIFNTIASTNAFLLNLNLPEIRSHTTIMKLVDMINRDRGAIYTVRLETAALKREIKVRKKVARFWVYPKPIPEYVKEEETI